MNKMNKLILGLIIFLLVFTSISFILLLSCNNTVPRELKGVILRNNNINTGPQYRTLYWNLKKPLNLEYKLSLNSDFYSARLFDNTNEIPLSFTIRKRTETNFIIEISYSESLNLFESKDLTLTIYTNNQKGLLENMHLIIDTNKPKVTIIKTSPQIIRGGCALLIFKIDDFSPLDVYIQDDENIKFYAQPFNKNGYYIGLTEWNVHKFKFSANLHAIDKAGNFSIVKIPLVTKNIDYKISKIDVKDNFVSEKKNEIHAILSNIPTNALEKYQYIIQTLQSKSVVSIKDLTSIRMTGFLSNFIMNPFKPIKNPKVSSDFGEYRIFKYKDTVVREDYHLGIDLFDIEQTKIDLQNSGIIGFSGYNGSSGNLILIHHGLGLYSVYMHCSQMFFKAGDTVGPGDIIGRTGQTGYALGDHLHFGMILQGYYVNPKEWMNSLWIQSNIQQVIDDALFLIVNESGS